MKILYLYSELMGYQIPVLKEYVSKYNAEVHVVHWDKKNLTPYKPIQLKGVSYYLRSKFSYNELNKFTTKLNPDITFISGWMDLMYLRAVHSIRKKGGMVVCGFDDIWFKTLKQRIASLLFPLFKKLFYSHAWVTGPLQFEYAKRLSFKNEEIIYNCYSADTEIFNNVYLNSKKDKEEKYPHKFLFVGRFENVKGIDTLIDAWSSIKESRKGKDWELTLIGNGSLNEKISKSNHYKTIDFMQPSDLVSEIKNYGCFILPSVFEPWALVIHEFVAAGFPIICSDICGASAVFVIDGYNGYTFKAGNKEDLEKQMLKIINSSDKELMQKSYKSNLLGKKITPELTAASFMSLVLK
jgi:glycosyltransferase involved in cell wall biosynthesis